MTPKETFDGALQIISALIITPSPREGGLLEYENAEKRHERVVCEAFAYLKEIERWIH